jgi:hypothetical protein
MRKRLSVIFSIIVWFSVIVQFVIMVQNRVSDIPETVVRFFSYFTILTNILAAVYFMAAGLIPSYVKKPGLLTAITVYIFMVGTVYQIVLRHLWQPTGMQWVVDELLHTINPLLVIIYWYMYEQKKQVTYGRIKFWIIYPLGYLAFVLVRGTFSNFYPYPFIDVEKIGWARVGLNSAMLTLFFIIAACLFILAGKEISKSERQTGSP